MLHFTNVTKRSCRSHFWVHMPCLEHLQAHSDHTGQLTDDMSPRDICCTAHGEGENVKHRNLLSSKSGRIPRALVSQALLWELLSVVVKDSCLYPRLPLAAVRTRLLLEQQNEAGGRTPWGHQFPHHDGSRQLLTRRAKDPLAIIQSKWKLKMAQPQDKSRICELRDWVILSTPRKNMSIYRLSPQYLRGSSEKQKKDEFAEVKGNLYSARSFMMVVVVVEVVMLI